MKKEEFIIENAKPTQTNKEWSETDLQRRKTLSEMLNAPFKKKGMNDYNTERVIYSWPEIYFTLGALVAKRDYAEFNDTIQRHERDIADLRQWRDEKKDQLL
jgi:hypothetical protein